MSQGLCINSLPELLALSRLISEARFNPNSSDKELWASPVVLAIAERVSAALIAHYEEHSLQQMLDVYQEWQASLPNNEALPLIRAKLARDAQTTWWSQQTKENKLRHIRSCITPFVAPDEFIAQLLTEIEATRQ